MNSDIENRLREALRPIDPPDGFEQRVLQQLANERPRRARRAQWLVWSAAMAASAALAVVLVQSWHAHSERRGLEARRQLIEALRVTGEKLDLVYREVNRDSNGAAPDPGA